MDQSISYFGKYITPC